MKFKNWLLSEIAAFDPVEEILTLLEKLEDLGFDAEQYLEDKLKVPEVAVGNLDIVGADALLKKQMYNHLKYVYDMLTDQTGEVDMMEKMRLMQRYRFTG